MLEGVGQSYLSTSSTLSADDAVSWHSIKTEYSIYALQKGVCCTGRGISRQRTIAGRAAQEGRQLGHALSLNPKPYIP